MSVKFPTKGSEMQSLYSLAWFGKSAGAVDPVFSGYHADEAAEVEDSVNEVEAEVLTAQMALRAEREPSAAELEWKRNAKRHEAQRVLQLVHLGAVDL